MLFKAVWLSMRFLTIKRIGASLHLVNGRSLAIQRLCPKCRSSKRAFFCPKAASGYVA